MRLDIFCIARAVALIGLMFNSTNSGIATAESRSGSEDLLFSYAEGSDRVAFGGVGYVTASDENMSHPDSSTLYVQDLKTGTKTKIFEAESGYVGYSKISPSGDVIAVEISPERGFHKTRLLVVNIGGKEIASFPQGRDFTWSPDSRFLAYITGDWIGIDTFRSTGTWLYDQRLSVGKKIFDKGEYVAWSQSDNSLYIWDEFDGNKHILRYDLTRQNVLETQLHGISFSPSGHYYHGARPSGGGTVDVFDASTNRPILSHRPQIARLLRNARFIGWAPQGDVLVMEVYQQELRSAEYPLGRFDTVLYDVAHDIARLIEDDSVIGWQNGTAVLHDKGQFTKRPLGTIPILPEQAAKPLMLPPSDHLRTKKPPLQ